MATIIDCGDGSFIAGDPPETLPEGTHWCSYCAGEGVILDLDWDDQLTHQICLSCNGSSTEPCDGPGCGTCELLWHKRLDNLLSLVLAAKRRAQELGDVDEQDRLFQRFFTVIRARQVRVGSITVDQARLEVLQDRLWGLYLRARAAENSEEVERQWARWAACNKRLDTEVAQ